ncbi:hypothetical protein ACFLQJ_01245 [Calditrichota bacterium]
MLFDRPEGVYSEFDKAVKSFPRNGGPEKLLVLNEQGLPIMQYEQGKGATEEIDEKFVALGTNIMRNLYHQADALEGRKPQRIALFFEDEIISLDWIKPFILIITWPRAAIKLSNSMDSSYLSRLIQTLQEELT